jgi:hypothetical protein
MIKQHRKNLLSHIYLAPNLSTWIVAYPFRVLETPEPGKKLKIDFDLDIDLDALNKFERLAETNY